MRIYRFYTFFLANLLHSNHNIRVDMHQFAPRLDFSLNWTDAQLHERYGLEPDDIEFIDLTIKSID